MFLYYFIKYRNKKKKREIKKKGALAYLKVLLLGGRMDGKVDKDEIKIASDYTMDLQMSILSMTMLFLPHMLIQL